MSAVTVSPKYEVVIPKNVRERLPLLSGDKTEVIQIDDRIELVPVKSIRLLRGFPPGWTYFEEAVVLTREGGPSSSGGRCSLRSNPL